MNRWIYILCPLCLYGCSVLPTKRMEDASLRASERLVATNAQTFRKMIEGEKTPPMPNVIVSGASNTVSIAPPPHVNGRLRLTGSGAGVEYVPYRETLEAAASDGQNATSQEEARSKISVSLPLGISLLLGAAGILAITLAIRHAITAARASSQALAAGMDAVDSEIAARIRAARERVSQSEDAAEMARLNAQIASDESLRGRVAAVARKPK